jgi:polyisoprenoid-binding protein YceI
MRKKISLLIVLSFVIFNCTSKEEPVNEVKKEVPQLEETNILKIDAEKSSIIWIGKKILSNHKGIIKILNGELVMRGLNVISGKIEVDMTSIMNTDIENEKYRDKLTAHLKNRDFFNIEEFPVSILNVVKSEKLNQNEYKFFGNLTIKNISHPVEFIGNIEPIKGKFISHLKLFFDRTLWNIKYNSEQFFEDLGDKMILDEIELNITIETE